MLLSSKQLLKKAMKLKLNCIENELLNEKKIGLKTLIALCLLYNKNLMYICKNKYFEIINDEYRKFFPKNPPARTFVTVGSWPWAFDIEIECTAICGDENRSKG